MHARVTTTRLFLITLSIDHKRVLHVEIGSSMSAEEAAVVEEQGGEDEDEEGEEGVAETEEEQAGTLLEKTLEQDFCLESIPIHELFLMTHTDVPRIGLALSNSEAGLGPQPCR